LITSLPDPSRRSVVTGIGVVAPNGIGKDAWWKATTAGENGIKRITLFDPSRYATQLAGEVSDFDAEDWIEKRMIVQTDRWTHMAWRRRRWRSTRPSSTRPRRTRSR
jgi:3-oxoacyl-(acyl-carrier-protein) synthase